MRNVELVGIRSFVSSFELFNILTSIEVILRRVQFLFFGFLCLLSFFGFFFGLLTGKAFSFLLSFKFAECKLLFADFLLFLRLHFIIGSELPES